MTSRSVDPALTLRIPVWDFAIEVSQHLGPGAKHRAFSLRITCQRKLIMNFRQKYLSVCIAALLAGASPAFAAAPSAPSLGTAADFAVLSAAPGGLGAVTCTDTNITGTVGSSGPPASITQTNCTISGGVIAPVSAGALTAFNGAYDALAGQSCDTFLTGTLAGVTLTPGVYCFAAAATLTGTLTLSGGLNDTWLFKVGTSGT